MFVYPVKSFTAETTAKILTELFEKYCPIHVTSDASTTFLSKEVQQVFKRFNINFYVAPDPVVKASLVERVILTIKRKIYKVMTSYNTQNFLPYLDDIVKA